MYQMLTIIPAVWEKTQNCAIRLREHPSAHLMLPPIECGTMIRVYDKKKQPGIE